MRLLATLSLVVVTACSSGSSAPPSAVPHPVVSVLPVGKEDLTVTGKYLSPEGFVPPLVLDVPAGWTSGHRGDDAFDLSRPDPTRDAPLVSVVLLTPNDTTSPQALSRLRRLLGAVTPVTGTLAGAPATGFDVVGGTGPLVSSPAGTIAVDRLPGQHARLLGTDLDGVPLLAVVVVPAGSRWAELLPVAEQLLAGVAAG